MMTGLGPELIKHIEREGWQGKTIDISHAKDLRSEILGQHRRGDIEENFYNYLNQCLNYNVPEGDPPLRSIIAIAYPQPIIDVSFEIDDGTFTALLPPTYNYRKDEKVINSVRGILQAEGYRVEGSRLPKKALAVHSGLAEYGKNNIAYIEGFGSFHRLVALYSDMPCESDNWSEPRMASECEGCEICTDACPTGAIDPERFIIRAERCLTFFNEGIESIPDWIEGSWHNALLGCLRCQMPCPMNRDRIRERENVSFDRDETRMILGGADPSELNVETVDKLGMLGMEGDVQLMSRNLRLLMERD